jgi:tetratricopeptide (TPR) repeat protein
MSRLAESTLDNQLYEQSVAYYKELIPLHERTQPNRGIGNGTLSSYYLGLANAYAGLKQTAPAVDAAGAGIIAWGSRHEQRASALETLRQVLLKSPDLDAYVVQFDKQKQDSPIIRKALGQVYRAKKEHAKAITQLELAAALQPNDAELYPLLLDSYDQIGDPEGAIGQLLQAVQHSRRDLALYRELGKRYKAAGQDQEAERAYTSIVEALPTEAESHALLAEVREKQARWPDAIAHWEQVARLRALEPTGLIKLANAQIHAGQKEQARETLRKLNARTWPPRFSDLPQEIRKLEERLR